MQRAPRPPPSFDFKSFRVAFGKILASILQAFNVDRKHRGRYSQHFTKFVFVWLSLISPTLYMARGRTPPPHPGPWLSQHFAKFIFVWVWTPPPPTPGRLWETTTALCTLTWTLARHQWVFNQIHGGVKQKLAWFHGFCPRVCVCPDRTLYYSD